MHNISHYQRNANQNHNEILSHSGENGHHQKVYKQSNDGVWSKGNLLHCWWTCKLVQPLIAQLVKNSPAIQETPFNSWVGKVLWRRDRLPTPVHLSFPYGSAGKEFTCNAEDLGLIPGWEDPLEKGKAMHSSILAWRIPMDRGAWQGSYSP